MRRPRNLDYRGFAELLAEQVGSYRGNLDDVVILAPDLFRFLTNLLEDARVPAEARRLITAALAYFVAPYDVEPEEIYGPRGFLDDVFLGASVARALREFLPAEVLETAWEADYPLWPTIEQAYQRGLQTLGEQQVQAILHYVGLA